MAMSFSRLSTFEQCPAKFEYLYVNKTIKDTDNVHTLYGSRVHKSLENYGVSGTPLSEETQVFAPLVDRVLQRAGSKLFEQQFAITRAKQPCDWFAKDVWIRGIADVLVLNGDRAWCLDWKTGKPKTNPTQLQLFAALIFIHYPEVQSVTSGFVWLNHNDIYRATYKRAHADHLWLALEPRFKRAQDAVDLGVFAAKPSGLCGWCPAKDVCPDAKPRR